ncbi:MAG: sulfatase [Planctomycetaceae bacterium]|nr:sulfatase [Planctomycetaceae bacterium]
MKRFTGQALACFLMCVLLGLPIELHAAQRNILFFLADDLGWKDLGCYGSAFYETPHLDKLASQGIRFTQAYTSSTVCSPTRASIITGQTPARHGCTNYGGSISKSHIGLAKALANGGYQTFFTGKWHIGNLNPQLAGFQRSQEISARAGTPEDPKSTRKITANTVKFLTELDSDKPFFAYVNYHAVHLALREAPELVAKYQAKLKANPPETIGPMGLEKERTRLNKQVQNIPEYAAMMEGIDNSVAEILSVLKKTGRAENTLVIFTSDNGGLSTKPCTSNLPLRAGKGWAYEGGIRVPLIACWPGIIDPDKQTDVPVTSMDFYPTLLHLAGLPLIPEQHVDGIDVSRLLTGGKRLERQALYWHYPHYHGAGCIPVGAMRYKNWKLVHWFGEQRYELYDLHSDPSELEELSRRDPRKLLVMKRMLTEWQQSFPGIKYDNPNTLPKK